jgi:penicillin-binding protein 1A
MNAILIKIFAVALTVSQVTTRSDIKTEFDPTRDRAEVAQLLRDGCAHMLKAFDVENINIDELIAVAMNDPQAVEGESKVFRGINLDDLVAAYRQFCKAEAVDAPIVDVGDIIAFYNKATADLPDATRLKEQKLRGLNVIFDGKGKRFADDYQPGQRRLSVPLSDVPEVVQQAFVAVEDKRFFAHHGVDERGLIRAFVGNLAQPGRPQGGSTITQQVVKNLLVGDDVTYERKIREMIVTSRMEHQLSKSEILELYLNSIYLGRSAWGIEMASRRYFGKSAKELSLAEGALLAGLTKGPSYFSPDRYPDRAQARFEYVLTRMQQDGVIDADQMRQTAASEPRMVALERPGRDSGLYFVDQIRREAKAAADVDLLTGGSYTVRSTINPALQRAVETALQDGLARYEISRGRVEFQGAETNLANTVRRIQVSEQKFSSAQAAWQRALATAHLMLYDVHWTPAIVTELGGAKSGIRVGLADGRTLPLNVRVGKTLQALKLYDVIYVDVSKTGARAELRVPPVVQGAAIVLENKTGKILAMTGGFSYPLSQLNRTTQAQRQPGSTIKPLTYLAALQTGLQPTVLVPDEPITLPPIGGAARAQEKDYWSPKNYEGGGSGMMTLRRGLENSRNLVTAHLLDGGIDKDPAVSLKRVCDIALEAKVYTECIPYYPFVCWAPSRCGRSILQVSMRPWPTRALVRPLMPSNQSSRTGRWCIGIGKRPRSNSRKPIGSRSISSRRCSLAWSSAAPRPPHATLRLMLAARPARPRMKTTLGLPDSPMTSRSSCGSATTTRRGRAAHWDKAVPERAWRCRSSRRSFGPRGRTVFRRWRWRRRRARRAPSSSTCRSISPAARGCRAEATKLSWSIFGSTPKARWSSARRALSMPRKMPA